MKIGSARSWKQVLVALAVLAGIGVAGRAAFAVVVTAKIMKVDVTTAYAPCTASNTSSNSGFNACLSPQLADPLCKFTVRGKGKVRLIALHDNVNVFGIVSGIEPGCEGQTLNLISSFRVSIDDCPPATSPSQSCTLVDFVDYPLGTCTVQNGICQVLTTLNTAAPGLVGLEKHAGIELMGCGFKRTSGTSLPARTFDCGIKVP
jgi:hypothetical protein